MVLQPSPPEISNTLKSLVVRILSWSGSSIGLGISFLQDQDWYCAILVRRQWGRGKRSNLYQVEGGRILIEATAKEKLTKASIVLKFFKESDQKLI